MGLRYPDQKHGNCFFVTTSFRDHREFGQHPRFLAELAESLVFCSQKYETRMAGYVLMPSHIHILPFVCGNRLGPFMRDFKKYTGQKVAINMNLPKGGIWTRGFDRVEIISEAVLRVKLRYIHENPVRAGLVRRAEDWRWSSAADYFTDIEGPIPIWKGWA